MRLSVLALVASDIGSDFLYVALLLVVFFVFFFFQAEDGIRDLTVTGVQTCALPISVARLVREGDPVGAIQAGDLGNNLPARGIDHHHAILACDEQAVAHRVERNVVPAAVAAQHHCPGEVVPLRVNGGDTEAQQHGAAGEDARREGHDRSFGERSGDTGKLMVTRVPVAPPGAEPISIRAPCASAIQRAIARPSPAPSASRRAWSPR